MFTNRAIYHDGWVACSRFGVPWNTRRHGRATSSRPRGSFTTSTRTSARPTTSPPKNPEKLKELQALFLEEAKKYDVFPLDPRLAERLDPRNRVAGEPRTSWTYYGNNVRLPEPIGPLIYPNSHTITAELTVPEKGGEGVIACCRRRLRRVDALRQGRQARLPLQLRRLRASTTVDGQGAAPGGQGDVEAGVRLQGAARGTRSATGRR